MNLLSKTRLENIIQIVTSGMIGLMVFAVFFLDSNNQKLGSENIQIGAEKDKSLSHDVKLGDKDKRLLAVDRRFKQAVVMLHAKEYEHAATALIKVIELSPRLVEAYVNLGYAFFGLKKYKQAAQYFSTAINLKPYQANAYWGLAVSNEAMGEVAVALGAMRTFIHLSQPDDPYVRRARSALWEWDEQLVRGPIPEKEQKALDKKRKQWEDRNSPGLDARSSIDKTVPTADIK